MKLDGDFTTIATTGPPEIEYPLKDHLEHFTVEQTMLVLPASYTGTPLDTAHADYPSAYCVSDTTDNTKGPLLEITRKWATVPAETNISDSRPVTFPAFGTATTSAQYTLIEEPGVAYQRFNDYQPRSSSLTLTVPVRRHIRYVLPGVSGEGSLEELPIVPRFRIANSTGQTLATLETAGADPDAAKYKNWIAAGVEIVVQATTITPYLGNIWRAETIYAKAR